MSLPLYRLLGQTYLATKSWESNPDVKEALSKAGLTKDRVEAGKKLVEEGQALAAKRIHEGVEDRIAEHATHTAVAELEMWQQTVKAALRGKGVEEAVIEKAIDHHLHAADHAVTAVASALRTLGILRTDESIGAAFPRQRSLHDLVVRGNTLLAKALGCTVVMLAPRGDEAAAIYGALDGHAEKLQAWVEELGRAVEKARAQEDVLGYVGYLPDGVGRPSGGTSFAVPLHQRAQAAAPEKTAPRGCAGWSVGRQGRNRENLGKGFVEPTFE